jgi:hypothetical protein
MPFLFCATSPLKLFDTKLQRVFLGWKFEEISCGSSARYLQGYGLREDL